MASSTTSPGNETLTPEVLWAQRSSATDAEKNFLYLTIAVPDVPASNLKLDLQTQQIIFEGRSQSLKKTYKLDITLWGAIDPAASNVKHTGRDIEIKLQKKELGEEYWPRLFKTDKKPHYVRTDFDKWVDEDEQDEAKDEDMGQFGGMGGMPGMGGMGGGMGGMPGMGGMGGGDFGGIDFSKLGGAGGMGGLGGLGGEDEDEDEDEDDDDDEMPALGEDEDEADAKGKGKAKIEEV